MRCNIEFSAFYLGPEMSNLSCGGSSPEPVMHLKRIAPVAASRGVEIILHPARGTPQTCRHCAVASIVPADVFQSVVKVVSSQRNESGAHPA